MPTITTTLLSPVLVAIAIPLAGFAVVTTTLAFSSLLVRVAVVYLELGAVVLHDHINGRPISSVNLPPLKTAAARTDTGARRKSRPSSSGSGHSETSVASLRLPENNAPGTCNGSGAHRDFEGVGGWVFGTTDEDDGLWTSMNSRLELPATVGERKRKHKHQRSMTSGAVPVTMLETPFRRVLRSPDSSNPPTRSRARTPNAPRSSSPVEYFAAQHVSKSTTALDTANMGRPLTHHKTSSSSTISSGSSGRTLGIKIPGE